MHPDTTYTIALTWQAIARQRQYMTECGYVRTGYGFDPFYADGGEPFYCVAFDGLVQYWKKVK